MAYTDLDDLLGTAAEIMQLDAAESSLGKGREWKAAKAQYDAAVEQFKTKRKDYVNCLLLKGEDWAAIPEGVAHQLDAIEAGADVSWHPAIQYTRENLLPYLSKEARKKPWVRDVIKWTPAALGVSAAALYFGIRLTGAVDVSAPIESRLGLQQRAAAAEKVIRYDDWMGTHVRRGGWLKGIMLWPIEPSEVEINGAGEFVSLVLDGYDILIERRQICGGLIGGDGIQLSEDQIKFVDELAKEIRNENIGWQNPPVMTILEPIKAKFPCP